MGSKRRRYDRQFKIEAACLITERGKRATEVARDLGVHVNLLYLWKKQLVLDPEDAFPGHGKLKPADEEMRHLKRELEDVKEERDILKKAIQLSMRKAQNSQSRRNGSSLPGFPEELPNSSAGF